MSEAKNSVFAGFLHSPAGKRFSVERCIQARFKDGDGAFLAFTYTPGFTGAGSSRPRDAEYDTKEFPEGYLVEAKELRNYSSAVSPFPMDSVKLKRSLETAFMASGVDARGLVHRTQHGVYVDARVIDSFEALITQQRKVEATDPSTSLAPTTMEGTSAWKAFEHMMNHAITNAAGIAR